MDITFKCFLHEFWIRPLMVKVIQITWFFCVFLCKFILVYHPHCYITHKFPVYTLSGCFTGANSHPDALFSVLCNDECDQKRVPERFLSGSAGKYCVTLPVGLQLSANSHKKTCFLNLRLQIRLQEMVEVYYYISASGISSRGIVFGRQVCEPVERNSKLQLTKTRVAEEDDWLQNGRGSESDSLPVGGLHGYCFAGKLVRLLMLPTPSPGTG